MDRYAVAIEGVSLEKEIDDLPAEILSAARKSVNATLRRGRTSSAKQMEREVNFPHGYLSGRGGRLRVSKYAQGNDLEGKITGRDRPTSLARFATTALRPGAKRTAGVTVEVKPGLAKRMPSTFAIKLRNGNIGLAYRSRNGRRPNSSAAKQIDKNLWLLYGPSVDQVFQDVRNTVAPDLEKYMATEFERLMDLE